MDGYISGYVLQESNLPIGAYGDVVGVAGDIPDIDRILYALEARLG